MFWENSNQHKGEGRKSRGACRAHPHEGTAGTAGAVGGAGAYATHEYDATESARYGLGSERHADDFYRVFGVDRDEDHQGPVSLVHERQDATASSRRTCDPTRRESTTTAPSPPSATTCSENSSEKMRIKIVESRAI